MKVYKLWVDEIDYDEYDSVVVVAENENEAIEIVQNATGNLCWREKGYFYESQGEIHIEEIDLTKKGVVLASYNAG